MLALRLESTIGFDCEINPEIENLIETVAAAVPKCRAEAG
jgi:hypothetical protein